jgi:hypothetical protein
MPEEAGGDSAAFDSAAVIDFINSGGYDDAPAQEGDPADDGTTQVEQTPVADLLGPDPDTSDLDPAVAALVNKRVLELRQGLTKRTTELSDANRILEAAGGDPEAILEAWSFQQSLLDDGPDGDAARARLYQVLEAQYGQQVAEQVVPNPEATPDDPFAEYDLPPEIRDILATVPQLKARLDAQDENAEAAAQQAAHDQYVYEVYNDLEVKLNEVTTEFPDLVDAKDDLIDLSYSTNGNVLKAMDKYRAIEARIAERLLDGAVNVPGGLVTPPVGGGHSSEPPVEFTDFKSLRGPVQEFLERGGAGA